MFSVPEITCFKHYETNYLKKTQIYQKLIIQYGWLHNILFTQFYKITNL